MLLEVNLLYCEFSALYGTNRLAGDLSAVRANHFKDDDANLLLEPEEGMSCPHSAGQPWLLPSLVPWEIIQISIAEMEGEILCIYRWVSRGQGAEVLTRMSASTSRILCEITPP
jgi:hypothetical protein